MKKLTSTRLIPAALGVALCLVANNAKAGNAYFDVNGTSAGYGIVNGGSYSWDDPNWAATSGGGNPTANWVAGSFARFYGGVSGDSYTVTANNPESMAGLYGYISGVSVTINGAGAGALDVVSGDQGFIATGNVTINAPVTGAGGVAPEGYGKLCLYGNNTYSGGTAFGYYGAPLTYFNNNNSFSTGTIRLSVAGTAFFQGLLGTGGSTITLANGFQNLASGSGVNFAADPNTPVISTGNWDLGANNLNLRSSGGSSSPVTISGAIGGTANVIFSANNAGNVITLSGPNTYSGTTTVTGPGAAGAGSSAITLKLGAANAIASSSSLIMAGGILDPGGFHHAMSSTTLGLTADSTIDFGAGASELDFANSSALTWTGTLNLASWDPNVDKLRFGTDASGLTSAQLADIEFNGAGLGTAQLDAYGFVMVPEPSTALLSLLGGLGVMWSIRRRKA